MTKQHRVLALAVIVLLGLAGITGAAESKYICKAVHLGTNAIAVSCTNGADPKGNTTAGVLIITCGK